jgi:hypothetical protein
MKDQQINNIESQTSNLTTEEFHKLLADNTAELNKLRMFYAENLAKMHDEYNDDMESFLAQEHQAKDEFHDAREAYEEAVNKYELHILSLRKSRNEAGHKYNIGKADLKNYWAKKNEKIQSERHNIFERYRDSGGVLTKEAESLLHPGWTRDKKGGMSDE